MEMVFYANLGMFSAVELQFGSQLVANITTHVSGAVTFLLLIAVFIHHMHSTLYLTNVSFDKKKDDYTRNDSKQIHSRIICHIQRKCKVQSNTCH